MVADWLVLAKHHPEEMVMIIMGLLATIAIVGTVWAIQWRKVKIHEQELAYRGALMERGIEPAEIEKAVAAMRRSLDQSTSQGLFGEFPERPFVRPLHDRRIAGVCGAIGNYFQINSTFVRLVWVMMALLTAFFPMFVAYVVFALVIPSEPEPQYDAR